MPIYKFKKIIGFFLLLAVVSLALFLYNKPAEFILTYYHVNNLGARFIALSLLVPYLIELLFAVIAYLSIRVYADALDGSKECSAFNDFKRGQFFVALNIGIAPLLSGIVTYANDGHWPRAFDATTIARYVNLAILIYAAFLLYRAGSKLLAFIQYDGQHIYLTTIVLYVGFTVLFAILGTRYVQQGSLNQQSLLTLIYPVSYDGSGLASVFTAIVPRLIAWFLIVLAIQNFIVFQRNVKGSLYKKDFVTISFGLMVAISSVISLRILQLLPISQHSMNPLPSLMLAYVIGLFGIVGFGLYAFGVNKLYAIEKA